MRDDREYYVIEIMSGENFVELRRHGIGESDDIMRVLGRRDSGPWVTKGWMVSKDSVEENGDVLSPLTNDTRKLFDSFDGTIVHKKEDIFLVKRGG